MNEGASSATKSPPISGTPAAAPGLITIDLGALAANYRFLRDFAAPADCAAVVKADAYGLGMDKVAPVLWREGCRSFFVATLEEAQTLRTLLPQAVIYAFNGLMPATAQLFSGLGIRPVLNSADEIGEWIAFCNERNTPLPAAIHIDSGMNRLGLPERELREIARAPERLRAFTLCLVMSHLACSDTPDHPKNEAQRSRFDELRKLLPEAPASLANSGGVMLGRAYHFDQVRPGIAIYGGQPAEDCPHRFENVVTVEGRILQIREAPVGETVGYGATRRIEKPARLATVAAGYADGISWILSAGDDKAPLNAYLGDHPAPIMGRVSMDLISLDVTGIPESHAHRGALVQLIGPSVPLETIAGHASTVNYEILTNLCRRAPRRYVDGEP